MWSIDAGRFPDHDEICRRAGGRRAYNAWRSFKRSFRLKQVVELLGKYGMLKHGVYARIARELGVSKSTLTRDVQSLRESIRPCSSCGSPLPRGRLDSPDALKDPLLPILTRLHADGLSYEDMADDVNEDGRRNPDGKPWTPTQVSRLVTEIRVSGITVVEVSVDEEQPSTPTP